MENQTLEKFTMKIENFSKLKSKKLYSETVVIGDCPWRILMFPYGNDVDKLSLYLEAAHLPKGWSRHVTFRLSLFNQVNSNMTITKETDHHFNPRQKDWGFTSFIPLTELHDPRRGFLVKDTCIVGAEVSVPKSGPETGGGQAASIIASSASGDQAGHVAVEVPQPEDQGPHLKRLRPCSTQVCSKSVEHADKEVISTSIGKLMDFRGLENIEGSYLPLLEEVCSQYPSLIVSQQKRSLKFTEWAFTALGRVLHFLKTKKGKDMNEAACMELQTLWEELEPFRFDLTWLEPHVQSALGMKNYMERAMQVEKLKENVVALEVEMEKLKAKLADTEVDLDIARTELLKAEQGFEVKNLDAELGYGRT